MEAKEAGPADILPRVIAKGIDFLLAMALMEIIPVYGYYLGLLYILAGDGFFYGGSFGKKLFGLVVAPVKGKSVHSPVLRSMLRNVSLALGFLLWRIPFAGWFLFIAIVTIEFIIMIGSVQKMRIGDEIAKTVVIQIAKEEK